MRRVRLGERIGGDDLGAVERAATELEAHPTGHVGRGRADATGRRLGVGVADILRHPLAVDLDMRGGMIVIVEVVGEAGAGARHPGRLVEPRGGEILPRLAGRVRRGDGPGGEPEIGVGVPGAEAVLRPEVPQAMQHRLAVVPHILQHVTRVVGESAAMAEHVADRHFAGRVGIVEREVGEVIDDLRVPGDDAVADDTRDDGGGQRLGERGKLEDGVGIDRVSGFGAGDAVAPGRDRLVLMHDRDGDAGYAGAPHRVGDDAVERVERLGDASFRGRRRCPLPGEGAWDAGDQRAGGDPGESGTDGCTT